MNLLHFLHCCKTSETLDRDYSTGSRLLSLRLKANWFVCGDACSLFTKGSWATEQLAWLIAQALFCSLMVDVGYVHSVRECSGWSALWNSLETQLTNTSDTMTLPSSCCSLGLYTRIVVSALSKQSIWDHDSGCVRWWQTLRASGNLRLTPSQAIQPIIWPRPIAGFEFCVARSAIVVQKIALKIKSRANFTHFFSRNLGVDAYPWSALPVHFW